MAEAKNPEGPANESSEHDEPVPKKRVRLDEQEAGGEGKRINALHQIRPCLAAAQQEDASPEVVLMGTFGMRL